MPTDVVPGSSAVSSALTAASSTSATTRGVPRTGTSPDPRASAVSLSVTAAVTTAARPGCKGIGLRYAVAVPLRKPATGSEGAPVLDTLDSSVIQRVLGTA